MKRDLSAPPRMLRVGTMPRAADATIERYGGAFGGGLLSGVSVITRGEALGHDLWIDAHFLRQVARAINRQSAPKPGGIKARFTHPGLSDDGLGKLVGRVTHARVDGDQVLADLHLLQTAHDTPDGDLADYLMRLAIEAPDAFGLSIVYEPDSEAEAQFTAKHTKDGVFHSPDADNTSHLPHARLSRLRAVDFVDAPAANPQGLFSAAGARVFSILDYAAGLTSEPCDVVALGIPIAPQRIRGAVARWLRARDLILTRRSSMSDEHIPTVTLDEHGEQCDQCAAEAQAAQQPEESPAPEAEAQQEAVPIEALREYIAEFGAQGAQWLAEGLSKDECRQRLLARQIEHLQEQVKALTAERDQLAERLSKAALGEKQPVSYCPEEGACPQGKQMDLLPETLRRYAAGLKLASN